MSGHTLAGTLPPEPPGPPITVGWGAPDKPLSAAQSINACICESHPSNCTSPASEQVSCDDSAQRRNPLAAAAHEGAIESKDAQFIEQSVPARCSHPVWAILAQVAEHEAETWAAVQ